MHYVPFTTSGDDTITALTALADVFKIKSQQRHNSKVNLPPNQIKHHLFSLRLCNTKLFKPKQT
jgi:hypothetical protein